MPSESFVGIRAPGALPIDFPFVGPSFSKLYRGNAIRSTTRDASGEDPRSGPGDHPFAAEAISHIGRYTPSARSSTIAPTSTIITGSIESPSRDGR